MSSLDYKLRIFSNLNFGGGAVDGREKKNILLCRT